MRLAIAGEALIDFTSVGGLSFEGREGGAPANVAIAAARMGQPTGFISQLSSDLFGQRLLAHLRKNGVDTRFVLECDAPSTLAFVERLPQSNRYAFYTHGTADTLWAPDPLPTLPESCRYLQFGSIALLHQPASGRILDLVEAARGQRVVVFDPNVRPTLIRDLDAWREQFRRWVAMCDLLKLSDEDAALIAPGTSFVDLAADLLTRGPKAVVVTRGAEGASLFCPNQPRMDVRTPAMQVADTIGAGDTFAAGLSVALLEQRVEHAAQFGALDENQWRAVLRFAATAAALNCTREGADPPWRKELDEALSQP